MSKETVNQETPIEEVKKVSRRGLGSARVGSKEEGESEVEE